MSLPRRTTPSADGVSRTDSLPQLSDRGRGLADLKGHDPMDRRLEVEKKERYGQALREQMALNAANRGHTPDREAMTHTPHWGLSGAGPPHGQGLPPAPPGDSPPSSGGTRRGRGGSTPLIHDHGAHTADRVAEVQDVMRQRINMLQEEQQRQWNSVQNALQQQMVSVREAADRAIQQQLEAAHEEHAAELRRALADLGSVRREGAAAVQRTEGVEREVDGLRQRVEQLELQGDSHRGQLDVHSAEIDRLKLAHEDCARFRAEVLREQKSLSDAVAQLNGGLREASAQSQEAARQVQKLAAELDRVHQARQEDARMHAELAQAQRASSDAIAQLRADNQELARRLGDVPAQLKRLRDEVPRLAAQAAREIAQQFAAARPEPVVVPPAPPQAPLFPAEVSPEAFALLRDQDGELYEFPDVRNVVGRGAACNVCVAGAPQAVSNRHAGVDIDREGKACIKDLGSRNGTFLNDRRVPQDAGFVIKSGDSVRLGVDGPTYMFEYGPAYYARWPQEPERVRSRGPGPSPSPSPAPAPQMFGRKSR